MRASFLYYDIHVGSHSFYVYTVDLVIFARFYFSQMSRGRRIREFKNLAIFFYNSATEEKCKFANSKLHVKSQN